MVVLFVTSTKSKFLTSAALPFHIWVCCSACIVAYCSLDTRGEATALSQQQILGVEAVSARATWLYVGRVSPFLRKNCVHTRGAVGPHVPAFSGGDFRRRLWRWSWKTESGPGLSGTRHPQPLSPRLLFLVLLKSGASSALGRALSLHSSVVD